MLATVATHHTPTSILLRVSVTILRDAFLQRLSVTLLVVVAACDGVSHLDDTLGVQSSARWEWHGRITVTQDPRLTLTRLAIDTGHGGGDVGLARYDFNPAEGEGDEYSLTLALDLGRARDLRQNVPYTLGPADARIPAYATVTCFCQPLKPDSVRAPSGSPRAACARSRAGWTRPCILRNGTTPPDTPPIRCTSALTWSSRAVGIVLGLLAARSPDHLTAQSLAPTIDTIIIVNRNVFDLQEADAPGFIARLANRLHARTRAGVIRGTLLVNRGDRYDSARVAESERALRNLSVFSRVRIDTTQLDGRLRCA